MATYVATNGMKVAGLYMGLKEQQGEGREAVLIFAGCLVLGAQKVENMVIAGLDKFFGRGDE